MAWSDRNSLRTLRGPQHVFPDALHPRGGGIASTATLEFYEEGDDLPEELDLTLRSATSPGMLLGRRARFSLLPGVLDVVSGYQQGTVDRPEYKAVCAGTTGHAESVKVVFDPDVIDFGTLCKYFMYLHAQPSSTDKVQTEAPNTALGFTPSAKSNSTLPASA